MTYTVICKIIYDKYRLARLNGEIFHREDYEWEIGALIFYNLSICNSKFLMRRQDEKPTLYGIPVRLNFNDQTIIELWRKVKW